MLWTTTYRGDAIDAVRADGYPVTDEALAHLSPAQHDHINCYGTYDFNLDADCAAKAADRSERLQS